MIKYIKIISEATQADVKLGSSMNPNPKLNKDQPPRGLLSYLYKPKPSLKHELASAQGDGLKAMKSLENFGYLLFKRQEVAELGIIDPLYRGQIKKVCTLLHNPEITKIEEFIEGINWLFGFINRNKNEVIFSPTTKIYLYEGDIPRVMTREVTVEEFK